MTTPHHLPEKRDALKNIRIYFFRAPDFLGLSHIQQDNLIYPFSLYFTPFYFPSIQTCY